MQAFSRESRRLYNLDRKRYESIARDWYHWGIFQNETVEESEELSSYAVAIIATSPEKRTPFEIAFLRRLEA